MLISQLCPRISTEALEALLGVAEYQEYKAKHFFLHSGERQRYIGFVVEGLVRAFYIDRKGNDITIEFIPEHSFVTHYSRLEDPEASKFYFQCLEMCRMVLIPYQQLAVLVEQYPELERFVRMMLEREHIKLLARLERQLFDDAEQRYLHFMEQHAHLVPRVSVSDLCSYLGVSRQTLTRIRKSLLVN